MAVPLVDGDILKCRNVCYTASQIGVNVYYMIVDNVVALPTDQDVATALSGLFHAEYKACLYNGAAWRGVGVQRVLPGPVQAEQTSVVNDGVGTAGANALATQTSGLLGGYTELAGRHYRSRMYIPFPAVADATAAGAPTAGYVARLANISLAFLPANAIVGAAGTCSVELAVRSFFLNDPPTVPSLEEFWPIRQLVPRPRWATQRRRGQFGAANVLPF